LRKIFINLRPLYLLKKPQSAISASAAIEEWLAARGGREVAAVKLKET